MYLLMLHDSTTNKRHSFRLKCVQICGAIFRMDGGGQEVGPGVSYVLNHPDLLETLFQG